MFLLMFNITMFKICVLMPERFNLKKSVRVCVWERERDRQTETDRERDTDRESNVAENWKL